MADRRNTRRRLGGMEMVEAIDDEAVASLVNEETTAEGLALP